MERKNAKIVFDAEVGGRRVIILRISAPTDEQIHTFERLYAQSVGELEQTPEVENNYRKYVDRLRSTESSTAYLGYPEGEKYKFVVLIDYRSSPDPTVSKLGLQIGISFSDDDGAVYVGTDGTLYGCGNPQRWESNDHLTRDRYEYLFEDSEGAPSR